MTALRTPQTQNRSDFPAAWVEFWEILKKGEAGAEYQNGQIIPDMSYEPDLHSKIANRFGHLFELLFDGPEFEIFNSNRPVYIAGNCQCVYNPDASVVQLPKEIYTYQPGMTAEMSPFVLVEVLSPNTRDRDFKDKLPCYKQIQSARYIIYAELSHPMVYVYTKDASGEWQKEFYDRLEDEFKIQDRFISLKDIYKRIIFSENI